MDANKPRVGKLYYRSNNEKPERILISGEPFWKLQVERKGYERAGYRKEGLRVGY